MDGDARRFCEEEFLAYSVYRELAVREKNEKLRDALIKASEEEFSHYEFWKSLVGVECGSTNRLKLTLLLLSRRVLGLAFTLRLLEKSERTAENQYAKIADKLPLDLRERLQKIIEEESEHEETWVKAIADEEPILRYLGFIALGVADSIVELTGVFAGFLGATSDARVAGLAGIVVGLAAALSMAGAAYTQARHEAKGRVNPVVSALATGLSYLIVVLLLSLPYLLFTHMYLALIASLAIAIIVVGLFTLYSSILKNTNFKNDFVETLGVMALTVLATFLVGTIIGGVFEAETILND